MKAAPLLAVRDLTVRVPGPEGARVPAVDGVSFTLATGERLGIVGESGAGKSLTTLALPGLLPRGVTVSPGSSIRLGGDELVGAPPSRLRRVRGGRLAMVFQDASQALNPVLTVGAHLCEVLALHRGLRGRGAVREGVRLLAEVGLRDPERVYHSPPHRLSGGMRQRAGIALALAGAPEILVADEPTSALDVTVQARILELLVRLSDERSLALVLVSHDLAVIAQSCHRVVVLHAGRVVEEGAVAEVLARPLHPYTAALLEARPRLEGPRRLPAPIPGVMPLPGQWPAGCRFHPRCPHVMDVCRALAPVTADHAGHRVACHLHPPEALAAGEGAPPVSPSLRQPSPAPAPATEGGTTAGGADPLLRIRDLRVHYPERRRGGGGGVVAVRGVGLDLHPGEVLGIAGESGSGKSSLARALMGLAPATGEVRIDGADLWATRRTDPVAAARQIQMVFQDTAGALDPRQRVGAALEEVLRVHPPTGGASLRSEVDRLLTLVGLDPEHTHRFPHQLSGGQRQRVGIARALAVGPAVLLLDEPVSALDVSVQARVLTLLETLRRQLGLSLVVIAHDLAVLRNLCDRVAIMHEGVVVELAPTATLFTAPAHPCTVRLLAAVPTCSPPGAVPGRAAGVLPPIHEREDGG